MLKCLKNCQKTKLILNYYLQSYFYFLSNFLSRSGSNEIVIKFLKGLIALDPNKRFTVEEALSHEFFKSLDEINDVLSE